MSMEFTEENFEKEVLQSDIPVLVEFWAEWCGPCKVFGPIIDELAEEYKDKGVKIGKMNVDRNQTIPGKFGIMSIPTLIFFKDGQPQDQVVGSQPKEKLAERLDALAS